ncbi:MAG: hypothetical protein ACXW3Y_07340 [Rhodoplanes sp.]
MTLHSLRNRVRPDNLKNQVRAGQSLARRIYLGALVASAGWIAFQVFGPMVFLDADGLVVQDRAVVAPAYAAQVVDVTVHPGDSVSAGARIGNVVSMQMLDLVSELTTREAQTRARQEHIDARLIAIRGTLPAADQRAEQSLAAQQAIERAMAGGFTTVTRRAEVAQARYEAAREAAALRAEAASLESEKTALEGNLSRIVVALEKARQTYRDGAIVASVGGTVGAKVVPAGTVLRPGEALADIYHGDKYVIAYLPTSRLYPIAIGKPVIVTDGVNRHKGHIERITDAVPAEFQSNFRSVERQQVARVMMDDVNSLPLLSKIKVTSTHSPANLLAEAHRLLVAFAGAVDWGPAKAAGGGAP